MEEWISVTVTQTRPQQRTQQRPADGAGSLLTAPLRTPGENPASDVDRVARAGANLYGAFSIETFCDVGALSLTHDDTAGFLAYTEQFAPRNFWYQDAGVRVWAYYEDYDNWQDTYGMDAVRAAYHCGHGGMDANGVFYVPMGAAWAGNDCTATSTNMRLGNERARYVFWSTCESLRVLGGHSPIRTWSAANQGLRMIFGFETVSWDDARYGSGFWNHWKRGESFSAAWMNSSWDIAHDQAPSVSANGASQQEAQDRLAHERFFDGAQASTAWWWWTWYDSRASAARESVRTLPADPRRAILVPSDARSLADLIQRFGLERTSARRSDGMVSVGSAERRLDVDADGLLTAALAEPDRGNRTALSRADAIAQAEGAVRAYGLDADGPVVLDRVAPILEAGGTDTGDGQLEGPYTTGTMVQFRQVIEGLPVITPAAGAVRVTVDNSGTVTHVQTSTRGIEQLSDRPRSMPRGPIPPGGRAVENDAVDPDFALGRAFSRRLQDFVARGGAPQGYGIVPGTTEIGYDVQGSEATVVARRAVELEFEGGFRKRYWVTATLFG
jgi:hypothetical protein